MAIFLFVCLFAWFFFVLFLVLLIAFNSSLVITTEGDDNFLVCIDIVSGSINVGRNVSIRYNLDGAGKNFFYDLLFLSYLHMIIIEWGRAVTTVQVQDEGFNLKKYYQ